MTAPTPEDLATLRRIWPDIVASGNATGRCKDGVRAFLPPEPFGVIWPSGRENMVDGLYADRSWFRPYDGANGGAIPDPTLPGTRAAVLAWLGLETWAYDEDEDYCDCCYSSDPVEHTPATFLAALVRWHAEHCG